jgi:hypothetical protein
MQRNEMESRQLWARQLADINYVEETLEDGCCSYFDPELAYICYSEIGDSAMVSSC